MDSESRELLLALAASAVRLAEDALTDGRLRPLARRALLEGRVRKLGGLIALITAFTRVRR